MADCRTLQNPCPEYLVRVGCFDAFAAGVENLRGDDAALYARAARLDPAVGYLRHPFHGVPKLDTQTGRRIRGALSPGMYTDDTERLIANARALLEIGPEHATSLGFATAYLDEFRFGGKRPGYAARYQAFLERVRDAHQFVAEMRPDSCRNGACMGVGVLGIQPKVGDVLRLAAMQASVTHNTRCGLFSARTVALAAHYAFRYPREERQRLRTYLLDHRKLLWQPGEEIDCGHGDLFEQVLTTPWDDRLGVWEGKGLPPIGLSTVQAALTLAVPEDPAHDSMLAALRRLLLMGGDTDSVAAVVAAIMAPWHRDEPFPDFLERDLELGSPDTGPVRLRRLGGDLIRRFA